MVWSAQRRPDEGLAEPAQQVRGNLAKSTDQIRNTNDEIHVLSINAKIEAARAGAHGRGFGVVADHIRALVARTNDVTEQMESHVRRLMDDLAAMATSSGEQFAEQAVHRSELVGSEEVLAYAATVRSNGDANGTVLGVLGILFRWRDLANGVAQRALQSIRDTEGEEIAVSARIVDEVGAILAATKDAPWKDSLPPAVQTLTAEGNGRV